MEKSVIIGLRSYWGGEEVDLRCLHRWDILVLLGILVLVDILVALSVLVFVDILAVFITRGVFDV